jgi:hypothetical protein
MSKPNCWETMKCGREPGGARINLGICPASVEDRLDGVHGGVNAGRACWAVAGTLCGGEVQGTFAQKYTNCTICEFYKTVEEEQGANFQSTADLLERLKKKPS